MQGGESMMRQEEERRREMMMRASSAMSREREGGPNRGPGGGRPEQMMRGVGKLACFHDFSCLINSEHCKNTDAGCHEVTDRNM